MPTDPAAALGARPRDAEPPIAYREEVRHPALDRPVISRGVFDIGPRGRLVRHQMRPVEEITSIGTHLITVSRPGDGYSNSVPIPGFMGLFLAVLREIVDGRDRGSGPARELALATGPAGWALTVRQAGGDSDGDGEMGALVLLGCGDVLRAISLDLPGGEERRIAFASE